jgi:NAD(P)-dependent dehydrogenase (short-subunit alcohol dehydrogenase family)
MKASINREKSGTGANRRLADRVALVTGGANGIGRASVELFSEEGAQVAYMDVDASQGKALEHELKKKGRDVHFIHADVSDRQAVQRSVVEAIERYKRIDVLFNHAGVISAKPFLECTEDEWTWMMNNNAKSVFLMTQAVLPGMLERGQGVIVATSSASARVATKFEAIYSASKAAMHQFCRAIAVEYRDVGIRCNLVCPSFVRTHHGMDELEQLRTHGVYASSEDVNFMQGRMCEPEEVAAVALFLASEEASFINGAEIFVDNTFTAV